MSASVQARATARALEAVLDSQSAPVGTFTVKRALPARARHAVGPWVFLDHFGPFRATPGKDGVGPHPHAGIETVTYLLSGRNEHRDSAGHHGIVAAGGAQWMTAGRGIVHAERPLAENGCRAHDARHPALDIAPAAPEEHAAGLPAHRCVGHPACVPRRGHAALVAGEADGLRGPAVTRMPTFLAHLALEPGAAYETALPAGYEAGLYVVEGAARIDGQAVAAGRLAVWAGTEGRLRVESEGPAPLQAMLLAGEPAEGPLVFHGPFVMNSVEQVRAAEIAYRTGRMGLLEE